MQLTILKILDKWDLAISLNLGAIYGNKCDSQLKTTSQKRYNLREHEESLPPSKFIEKGKSWYLYAIITHDLCKWPNPLSFLKKTHPKDQISILHQIKWKLFSIWTSQKKNNFGNQNFGINNTYSKFHNKAKVNLW